MKRIRNADASIIEFAIVCPYKQCGFLMKLDRAKKGDVIVCGNCRKEIKVRRVI